MSEDVQGFRFRATPRVPFRREVRLRFDRIGGSVSGTTTDLSTEGMFVATGEYKPIGTLVQFEFENDAGETVQGLADIVWIREVRQGTDREPGMGLHFRYVDPRSRELIAGAVRDLLADKEEAPATAVAPVAPATEPAAPVEAAPADEVPTSDAEPVDDTAPSIVWSEAELPTHRPTPLATSAGDEDEARVASPSEAAPTDLPSPIASGAADAGALSPRGGTAAVWSGSDAWLRAEAPVEERMVPARGAAALRRSHRSVWWLVAVLLVLLAAAAAVAYYRWQGKDLFGRAAPPQAAAEAPTATGAGSSEPVEQGALESAGEPAAVGEPPAGLAGDGARSAESESGSSGAIAAPGIAAGAEPDVATVELAETTAAAPGAALVAVAEPAPQSGALRVSSDSSGAATVVRISAPWELRTEALRSFRLEGPPRFVVQVRGAGEAVPGAVDSGQVRRMRIGVHDRDGESEIHFVFDLDGAAVRAQAAVIDGVIVVTFAAE